MFDNQYEWFYQQQLEQQQQEQENGTKQSS